MEKEYEAVVEGPVPNVDELKAALAAGVPTTEGTHTATFVEASELADGHWRLTLIVREGKHRMVRRMLANVGHPVIGLHRRRFGSIVLGASGLSLSPGEYVEVDEDAAAWAEGLLRPR